MSFIIGTDGAQHQITLDQGLYAEAKEENLRVPALINAKYPDADPKYGTAFQQLCASNGLAMVGQNKFGLRAASLFDILEGNAGMGASSAAGSRERSTQDGGTQSRILFPSLVIEMVEDMFYDSRADEDANFRSLVKVTVPVGDDMYRQPVLSYQTAGGANGRPDAAKAARVTQMGELPNILRITTSERAFNIPAYGIGIEMSVEAQKGTTLDLFGLTMKRYIDIEHNGRVNGYLSDLYMGDVDQGTSAINAVTTLAMDPACPTGKVTHRAWLKFLARNRRRRKITHAICDLDTYLKIEAREGRPGSNAYDPRLATIDPQLVPKGPLSFGNNVVWMIVDSAAEGGPVPANTVFALDREQAIKLVTNTSADYKATEEFVLRRSSRMVWTWSEIATRLYTDDNVAFDILTIV